MAPRKAAMAAIVPSGYSGIVWLFQRQRQKNQNHAHRNHGQPVAFAATVYAPSEVAMTVPTYFIVVVSSSTMSRSYHSAMDVLVGS